MDGNLFASILDSNKQISQQIGELGADYVGNVVSSTLRNWGAAASDVRGSTDEKVVFLFHNLSATFCSISQQINQFQSPSPILKKSRRHLC
jgi:hypothetical protein